MTSPRSCGTRAVTWLGQSSARYTRLSAGQRGTLAQLAFLHFTLANSPVSYGVPTYQTLLTVLTIVSGGVFFSEFDRMPPAHFVCFVAGVAILERSVRFATASRAHVVLGAIIGVGSVAAAASVGGASSWLPVGDDA